MLIFIYNNESQTIEQFNARTIFASGDNIIITIHNMNDRHNLCDLINFAVETESRFLNGGQFGSHTLIIKSELLAELRPEPEDETEANA